MKHKVSELEGVLLDAAVAKAEGHELAGEPWWPRYGTDWNQAGPIIEREQISVTWPEIHPEAGYEWHANLATPGASFNAYGSTPLIAAMRAYVASQFGEEVELP